MGDYTYRGIIRRDFRATHTGLDEITPAKHPRKNTIRWCRGKVGQPHVFEKKEIKFLKWQYTENICLRCGKKIYTNES